MRMNTSEFAALSNIKEYAAILIIKLLIAVTMFAFSAAMADLAKSYLNRADGWFRERSEAVSHDILDLYR